MTPTGLAIRLERISPHTRAAVVGIVVGALTLFQGYFHTGHMPSSVEVATVLSGAGITGASVIAFIAAHLGLAKVGTPATITNLASLVNSAMGRVSELDAGMAQRFRDLVASLPAPVQPDVNAIATQVHQLLLADLLAQLGQPAGGGAAPAVPAATTAGAAGVVPPTG